MNLVDIIESEKVSPLLTHGTHTTHRHIVRLSETIPDLEGCSADKNLRTSFGLNFLLQYIAFLEEAPAC